MIQYITIFTLFFLPLIFFSAYGEVIEITTDKSVYFDDEIIHVSGNVSSESDSPTVTIVIFNPDRSNFVTLSSAIANSDGFFYN